MAESRDQELLNEIRELRVSIDELSGLLRSIFRHAIGDIPAPKPKSVKRKRSAGAVEKKSRSKAKKPPTPGRHF